MDEIKRLLTAGVGYRFCSLLFRYPSEEVVFAAASLLNELSSDIRNEADALVKLMARPPTRAEYHSLLGSCGSVSPYESTYQADQGVRDKGAVLGDVAGFYQAFGFESSRELLEAPDHISVELAFLSYLKLKAAYALMNGNTRAYHICCEAEERFTNEHLLRWLPEFITQVGAQATDPFYRDAARVVQSLGRVIAANETAHSPRRHRVTEKD
ncbi:MAG: hypothetical protein Kow0099_33080 [Candidatus Abyssubacteria bacterium]